MRKWGLHSLLCLIVLAVVLAGCGAGNNNSNSAADTAGNALTAESAAAVEEDSAASVPAAKEMTENFNSTTAVAVNDQNAVQVSGANPAVPNPGAEQAADASAGFTGTDVVAGLNKS